MTKTLNLTLYCQLQVVNLFKPEYKLSGSCGTVTILRKLRVQSIARSKL